MKELEIILCALKAEALTKPKEIIFVGTEAFTYEQFVTMLEKNNPKGNHERFVKNFLASAQQMFKTNPTYRRKMMLLAGVKG